jgi:hemerythrin
MLPYDTLGGTEMLASLQWEDKYSVNIPEVDSQHKVLFKLIERLDTAIREKRGSAACQGILGELVDYTRIHFALEESLMRLARYPEFDGHKQLHESLIAEVGELQKKIACGTASISFELMQFLRVWLTKHIMQSDQKYAAHFENSGFSDFGAWEAEARATTKKRKWWKFW